MNYNQYINNFLGSEKEIPAQLLYDWQSVTGFISGTALHDAFYGMCGEPSPSGYEMLDADAFLLYFSDLPELQSESDFISAAKKYDENLDFGISTITSELDIVTLYHKIKIALQSAKSEPTIKWEWPRKYYN